MDRYVPGGAYCSLLGNGGEGLLREEDPPDGQEEARCNTAWNHDKPWARSCFGGLLNSNFFFKENSAVLLFAFGIIRYINVHFEIHRLIVTSYQGLDLVSLC